MSGAERPIQAICLDPLLRHARGKPARPVPRYRTTLSQQVLVVPFLRHGHVQTWPNVIRVFALLLPF